MGNGDFSKEASAKKAITVEERKVSSLDLSFGNPRKIKKKKAEELRRSLEEHGDFGSFVIDDKGRVISGNQRAQILNQMDPDTMVTCKVLHGYSEQELRRINVASNTHAGGWDFDILAEWFSDIDLSIDEKKGDDLTERTIQEMMPVNLEKYDFVVIVCRNELDFNHVERFFGLSDKKVKYSEKAKKKARAVFFDGQF